MFSALPVLLVLLPVLFYFLYLETDWRLFVEIIILLAIIPVFAISEEKSLYLLVLLRPMIDSVGAYSLLQFGTISLNLASMLSLLVILWALLTIAKQERPRVRMPLAVPIALFLAVAATGLLLSPALEETAGELLRIGSFFLLYIVAKRTFVTPQQFNRFAIILACSLIVPVVVGLVQFVTHTGLTFGDIVNRVYGTFGNPNSFAYYLVLSIVFFLCLLLSRPELEHRIPVKIGLGLLTILLVLTATRGAWLALLVSLFVIGIVKFRKATLVAGACLIALMLFLPTANRLSLAYFNVNLERLPGIQRLFEQPSEDGSLAFRLKLWKEMRRKFDERPLLGFGLGTFSLLREQQIKEFFQGTEAHNDYLRLAVETGIVGLAAYGILLVALFRALLAHYRRLAGSRHQLLVLGVIAYAIALLVGSFFDNLLQSTTVMWVFWIMVAAVLNLKKGTAAET